MADEPPLPKWHDEPWTIKDPENIRFATPPVLLGRGALGEVHRATYNDQNVAVKSLYNLSAEVAGESISWDQKLAVMVNLHKECRLLATVRSDYIVQFLGMTLSALETPQTILMELLRPFKSVYALPLDGITWMSCMTEVWRGLAVLEEHKVVHRDIKPANLLIAEDGHIKLGDLGEARDHLTLPGTVGRGTLTYMPPETRQAGRSLTPASDWFAAVIMGIELALGEEPSPLPEIDSGGVVVPEIARRRAQFDEFVGRIPWVRGSFEKCLSNDPSERPSLRVLQHVTLTAPSALVRAQCVLQSGSDENGAAARFIQYFVAEPILMSDRELPSLAWSEMTHHTDDEGTRWHLLHGKYVDIETYTVNAASMLHLTTCYRIHDNRWQKLLAVCANPGSVVRERMHGTTLACVSPDVAFDALVAAAEVLVAAHHEMICHGALTCENVVVTACGVCLLHGGTNVASRERELGNDCRAFARLVRQILAPPTATLDVGRIVDEWDSERAPMTTMLRHLSALAPSFPRVDVANYTVPEQVPSRSLELVSLLASNVLPIITLRRQLASEVLPSMFDNTRYLDIVKRGRVCELFEYLLGFHVEGIDAAIEAWSEVLLLELITVGEIHRAHSFCTALLRYARNTQQNPALLTRIVEVLLCASDRCMDASMPHAASFFVENVANFVAATLCVSGATVQRTMSLRSKVFSACAAGSLSEETKLFSLTDSALCEECGEHGRQRSFHTILADMTYASYRLVNYDRTDFSWHRVYELEFEYILQNLRPLDELRDAMSIARQRVDKADAFVAQVYQLGVCAMRAERFAAAAQLFYMALTVREESHGQYPELVAVYTQSFIGMLSGKVESSFPQIDPARRRTELAQARKVFIDSVAVVDAPVLKAHAEFSINVVRLVGSLVDECCAILHPAPCQVAFVALGATAGTMMSLFSSLEFAVVTGSPFVGSTRDYVTRIVQLLQLKISALGETPVMPGNVHQIHGLRFDRNGNTPLNKEPPLVGTVSELVNVLLRLENGTSLLATQSHIAGDETLFHDLRRECNMRLGDVGLGTTRLKDSLQLFDRAISFHGPDRLCFDQGFDAETTLLRMPQLFLNGLVVLYNINCPPQPRSVCDTIDELVRLQFLHTRIGDSLRRAFSVATCIRVLMQNFYNSDIDTISSSPPPDGLFALPLEWRPMLGLNVNKNLKPLAAIICDYAARLRVQDKRHLQGASLQIEFCRDSTRFVDAIIIEKVAAVCRPNHLASIAEEIRTLISRRANVTVPSVLLEWLANDVHPWVYAARAKIPFAAASQMLQRVTNQVLTELENIAMFKDCLDVARLVECAREQYCLLTAEYESADAATIESLEQAVSLHGVICGHRTLAGSAAAKVFMPDGSFVGSVCDGQHLVNNTVSGVHLKKDPSFPSVEYAVSVLGYLLDVHGVSRVSPATEFFVATTRGLISHFISASETVSGTSLHIALRENPRILDLWRPAHFSLSFIYALLVCPEDGKPDNFIVVGNPDVNGGTISVDVVSIDNDHAFVSPFECTGWIFKSERLFMKSIVFCCDQMQQPIDSSVREAMSHNSASEILRYWLLALRRFNISLQTLVPESEIQRIFASGAGPCLPFIISTPVLKDLYERCARVIDLCTTNASVTHFEILRAVAGQKVHDMYERTFSELENPLDRFDRLTKSSYTRRSNGTYQTTTSPSAVFRSHLRGTTASNTHITAGQYNLDHAIEALNLIDAVHERQLIDAAVFGIEAGDANLFRALTVVSSKEQSLARVNWERAARLASMDEFSKLTRDLLDGQSFRNVQMASCTSFDPLRVLTDSGVNFSQIVAINVSGSSIRSWNVLPERCVSLETLCMRNCVVESDSYDGFSMQSFTDFPSLRSVDIRGARNMKFIDIPRLECLRADWLHLMSASPGETGMTMLTIAVVCPGQLLSKLFGGALQYSRRRIVAFGPGHPVYDSLCHDLDGAFNATPFDWDMVCAIVRAIVGVNLHQLSSRCLTNYAVSVFERHRLVIGLPRTAILSITVRAKFLASYDARVVFPTQLEFETVFSDSNFPIDLLVVASEAALKYSPVPPWHAIQVASFRLQNAPAAARDILCSISRYHSTSRSVAMYDATLAVLMALRVHSEAWESVLLIRGLCPFVRNEAFFIAGQMPAIALDTESKFLALVKFVKHQTVRMRRPLSSI